MTQEQERQIDAIDRRLAEIADEANRLQRERWNLIGCLEQAPVSIPVQRKSFAEDMGR